MLDKYLEKLEHALEGGYTARVRSAYERVFAWEEFDELPFIWSDLPPIADEDWPCLEYNDTFVDHEKMLLSELRPVYLHCQSGDYQTPAIRTNYGTVILPSILGAPYQLTETSMPWAHHLPDRAAIRRLIDVGLPDPHQGLGATCFETADYYRETLAPYPHLSSDILIYHPDLQGPFDVAHLLWGPDIFLALYDVPDMVHALLELVTRTYIAWLKQWKDYVGEGNDFTAHWSFMQRGGAMLRDDSAVMLSRSQYLEFIRPYDQQVLDAFGGCIHFCGRGDQFVEPMAECRNLYALNLSQPELNDMQRIWRVAREHRLVLLGLREAYVPLDTHAGVVLYRSWSAAQGPS